MTRTLFWIGLAVLILGVASLIVPIPGNERDGVTVGGMSLEVETRSEEKLSPLVSSVMILGGLGAMIAGKRKR